MALKLTRLRALALAVSCGVLSACGTQEGPTTSSLIFERLQGAPEPSRFSPSRAELAAAGITQPLLRVVSQVPVTQSAGYIFSGQSNGVLFYGANDGSQVLLRGGLIQSTVGFVGDLESTQTGSVAAALTAGQGTYSRVLRHRRGEGNLFETVVNCAVQTAGAEQITILGKTHATTRMTETCRAPQPDGAARTMAFTSTYWVENGGIRASEQWISYETGNLRLEQVLP